MIVIEGADCVGKTTFCTELIKWLQQQEPQFVPVYQHLSRLPDGVDGPKAHLSMMGPLQVRDRFHMSEVVYSAALNRVSHMDPVSYEIIDARIALMGGMVVVLTAANELIQARYSPREMFPLSAVLDINDRFAAIAAAGYPRSTLKPGRTYNDRDPEPRFEPSPYSAHGVRMRVDVKVHMSYTNWRHDFQSGVERVGKKYLERQCSWHMAQQRGRI